MKPDPSPEADDECIPLSTHRAFVPPARRIINDTRQLRSFPTQAVSETGLVELSENDRRKFAIFVQGESRDPLGRIPIGSNSLRSVSPEGATAPEYLPIKPDPGTREARQKKCDVCRQNDYTCEIVATKFEPPDDATRWIYPVHQRSVRLSWTAAACCRFPQASLLAPSCRALLHHQARSQNPAAGCEHQSGSRLPQSREIAE